MNAEQLSYSAIAGIIFCVGFVFGVMLGSYLWEDPLLERQTQAIEMGYAEWVVSIDGSTKFKWNEPPE